MSYGIFAALIIAMSPVATPPINPPRVDHLYNSLSVATNEKHIIVLYYTTYCPYSQKVLRYLKKIHKQLPMKNVESDPQAKAELKKTGGKTQVPCLVIDGKALYESDAIIEWLSQHQDELENS